MNIATLTDTTRRELARRISGGIEIILYWNADDDSTVIELYHQATGETTAFRVTTEQALDAFYHPYAYIESSLVADEAESAALQGSHE